MIAEISSRFVNLSTSEVDREIEDAQRRLCQFLGLDFSTLWQWSDEPPGFFKLTHFYTARDGPQPPDRMNQDQYPWAGPELLAGHVITVDSVDDLPAEAARDAETLRRFGIKSNMAFPLSMGGETPFGVLGFGTMQKERKWPKILVNRLRLVAQIFAGALARRKGDEALQASQAHLLTGTELAGLGYYEVDLASSSCLADERFSAIFGIPSGQQQGLWPLEFWMNHLHPDDRERVMDERRQLHAGRIERLSVEYRFLHPTAKVKWLHHLARVTTRDASGQAVRTFGVVRDITQRRQAEMDIEELRGNLTHLSRVNSLGALSGSLAHELNQPLGIILSNAQAAEELLLQEPLDLEELKDILSDIVAADRRASDVILRLRALLKRGQVALQPLDLNEVIDEVLQAHHGRSHRTRASPSSRDLAPDLPPVAGDRVQIQQVVLNLVLNAAEAMAANAPGTRRLQIRTVLEQDGVRTLVRDEGEGLPGDVDSIFKPFYSTKAQGLGMGLSICSSIVAAHNGRLWAESNLERGAVFLFELPVAASPKA